MSHDPRWFAEPFRLKDYPSHPGYPVGDRPQVEQLLDASRLEASSAIAWTTTAGWRIPYRSQPHCYLWIVLEGEGSVRIDGLDRPFQVSPEDSFLIPEQAGHEIEPTGSANFKALIFHFVFRYFDALDVLALVDLRGPISQVQPEHQSLAMQLCKAYAHQLPSWRAVLRAGLLYLLYPAICNAAHRIGDSLGDLASPGLRRLLPAFVLVRQKAHRHDLRVEEIAAAAGVSEVYLRRLFRQHLNKTPHEFLLEERLTRGKDLLIHSEATIDQVAAWAGFENPSYFHRVFKHHFGTSPGAYRRRPAV